MKSGFLFIITALAMASCAMETTPAAGNAAAQAAASVKPERRVAPEPPVAAKPEPYPLQTCLVTGDDLDEMDERVATVDRCGKLRREIPGAG